VLENGQPGDTYNIGGGSEKTNVEVVRALCALLDECGRARAGATRS
jgi:dTDP-glucose 4,6-dehydratase